MSLRTRVALVTGLVTALVVLSVSVAAWAVANRQLLATVDDQLDERAELIDGQGERRFAGRFLTGDVAVLVLLDNGAVVGGELTIEPREGDFDVVEGRSSRHRYTTTARSSSGETISVRVLTVDSELLFGGGNGGRGGDPLAPIGAVMLVRPLTEVDESLERLRGALIIVSVVGVLAAALAGLIVADRAVRPVARLTGAAERVAATRDLDTQIDAQGRDELGRLGRAFNAMMTALRTSKEQQDRLVHDASHELRTPLTSLRTNIELLQRAEAMPAEARAPILDDVVLELDELTALVTELVDLATDQHVAADESVIDLGDLVDSVVDRHRRRTDNEIVLTADDVQIRGVSAAIDRAVNNLVDNAVKFTPDGGRVEVDVTGGVVTVADEGPGIEPADRASVFERFWRADTSRTLPGSGLGLSIVADVATSHGGSVEVIDGHTSGATLRLDLSAAAVEA